MSHGDKFAPYQLENIAWGLTRAQRTVLRAMPKSRARGYLLAEFRYHMPKRATLSLRRLDRYSLWQLVERRYKRTRLGDRIVVLLDERGW